jgi:hypothetical protein
MAIPNDVSVLMLVFCALIGRGESPYDQGSGEPSSTESGVTEPQPPRPTFVDRIAGCSAEDLGVKFIEETRDEETGFLVGGTNPTDTIRLLRSVNGLSIADLEKQMRPGAPGEEGSKAGFLGPAESLLAVLAADNELVVDKLKLTHQDLARPLLLIGYYAKEHAYSKPMEVEYGTLRLKVSSKQYKGYQHSPFHDRTKTDTDVTVVNTRTGQSLTYSLLVPHMIERYGFYEGHGTKYRVEPKDIISLLQPKRAPNLPTAADGTP